MIPTLIGNAKGENICWTISKDIEVEIKSSAITKLGLSATSIEGGSIEEQTISLKGLAF